MRRLHADRVRRAPAGAHCEGGVWATLFGLLLWPALFAPVPDALRRCSCCPCRRLASQPAHPNRPNVVPRPERSARAACATLRSRGLTRPDRRPRLRAARSRRRRWICRRRASTCTGRPPLKRGWPTLRPAGGPPCCAPPGPRTRASCAWASTGSATVRAAACHS